MKKSPSFALALPALAVTLSLFACSENLTPQGERTPYEAPAVEKLACVPNLDGRSSGSTPTPAANVRARPATPGS